MSIRQAIRTTFKGPTNTKGSRIQVEHGWPSTKSRTYYWTNHELSADANHQAAAQSLASKRGWGLIVAGGQLADGSYCWLVSILAD